jgi:hypothetical protein
LSNITSFITGQLALTPIFLGLVLDFDSGLLTPDS